MSKNNEPVPSAHAEVMLTVPAVRDPQKEQLSGVSLALFKALFSGD